jgi:hypothetical protein
MTDLERRLEDLEKRKQVHLDIINEEYYDTSSPHYKDNERFTWASETIDRKFKEEAWEIIDEEIEKPIVRYLTEDQILMEYGDVISKEELNQMKEQWKQY